MITTLTNDLSFAAMDWSDALPAFLQVDNVAPSYNQYFLIADKPPVDDPILQVVNLRKDTLLDSILANVRANPIGSELLTEIARLKTPIVIKSMSKSLATTHINPEYDGNNALVIISINAAEWPKMDVIQKIELLANESFHMQVIQSEAKQYIDSGTSIQAFLKILEDNNYESWRRELASSIMQSYWRTRFTKTDDSEFKFQDFYRAIQQWLRSLRVNITVEEYFVLGYGPSLSNTTHNDSRDLEFYIKKYIDSKVLPESISAFKVFEQKIREIHVWYQQNIEKYGSNKAGSLLSQYSRSLNLNNYYQNKFVSPRDFFLLR